MKRAAPVAPLAYYETETGQHRGSVTLVHGYLPNVRSEPPREDFFESGGRERAMQLDLKKYGLGGRDATMAPNPNRGSQPLRSEVDGGRRFGLDGEGLGSEGAEAEKEVPWMM